jgi:lipoprotein NlpD
VGQVLRVLPPADGVAVAKPVVSGVATATPIAAGPAKPASTPATAASSAAPSAAPAAAPVAAVAASEDDIGWIWPTGGPVLAGFDEAKNKGLDIGGKAGEPVVASADGKVVYAGAGLRGYGNLIILKHNNVYLTAYAHNQSLMVKEDQSVKKGQKIAEMGNSDADRVKLHFEVRRQGKPVDPAKYLPAR